MFLSVAPIVGRAAEFLILPLATKLASSPQAQQPHIHQWVAAQFCYSLATDEHIVDLKPIRRGGGFIAWNSWRKYYSLASDDLSCVPGDEGPCPSARQVSYPRHFIISSQPTDGQHRAGAWRCLKALSIRSNPSGPQPVLVLTPPARAHKFSYMHDFSSRGQYLSRFQPICKCRGSYASRSSAPGTQSTASTMGTSASSPDRHCSRYTAVF